MASVTALQLVNRVRLYRRQPTTTTIATPEDEVTLNAINMAIEEVLASRKWEFNLRHDGLLGLRGQLEDCTMTLSEGSTNTAVSRSALVDADVFGDYAVRMYPTGSEDYSSTAVRLKLSGQVALGTISTGQLDSAFPADVTSVSGSLFYSEYMLPDTVESVVRAEYQESELSLEQVDPTVRYSELFPSPQIRFGPPESIAIGGYDQPTYRANATEPEPKLRLAVWPVPDAAYVISYSYYYRHPELTSATDELIGVPPATVNDIVLHATAVVKMAWDADYAASHFADMAFQGAGQKYRQQGGSPGRRHTVHSFERGSRRYIQLGFPGKVIG